MKIKLIKLVINFVGKKEKARTTSGFKIITLSKFKIVLSKKQKLSSYFSTFNKKQKQDLQKTTTTNKNTKIIKIKDSDIIIYFHIKKTR